MFTKVRVMPDMWLKQGYKAELYLEQKKTFGWLSMERRPLDGFRLFGERVLHGASEVVLQEVVLQAPRHLHVNQWVVSVIGCMIMQVRLNGRVWLSLLM